MMQLNIECNCAVCTARRMYSEFPEHVQQTHLRLEHSASARARRGGRIMLCVLSAALLFLAAMYAYSA
jgi:hypothetical protein